MNAEVIRILKPCYDNYFKCWSIRFRVRCPRCYNINKHGEGLDKFPETIELKGSRGCDFCRLDYRFWWKQGRGNIPDIEKEEEQEQRVLQRKERRELRVSGADNWKTL